MLVFNWTQKCETSILTTPISVLPLYFQNFNTCKDGPCRSWCITNCRFIQETTTGSRLQGKLSPLCHVDTGYETHEKNNNPKASKGKMKRKLQKCLFFYHTNTPQSHLLYKSSSSIVTTRRKYGYILYMYFLIIFILNIFFSISLLIHPV